MIDLDELQRRFPHQKIRSQPATGCGCKGTGVRHIASLGRDAVCICVCMSAPEPGEPKYRVDIGRAVGRAAKAALDETRNSIIQRSAFWANSGHLQPRRQLRQVCRVTPKAWAILPSESPSSRWIEFISSIVM